MDEHDDHLEVDSMKTLESVRAVLLSWQPRWPRATFPCPTLLLMVTPLACRWLMTCFPVMSGNPDAAAAAAVLSWGFGLVWDLMMAVAVLRAVSLWLVADSLLQRVERGR